MGAAESTHPTWVGSRFRHFISQGAPGANDWTLQASASASGKRSVYQHLIPGVETGRLLQTWASDEGGEEPLDTLTVQLAGLAEGPAAEREEEVPGACAPGGSSRPSLSRMTAVPTH